MRKENKGIKFMGRVILIFLCLLSFFIGCEQIKSEKVIATKADDALGATKSEKAVKPLIQALKDEDSRVRSAAAFALRLIYSKIK